MSIKLTSFVRLICFVRLTFLFPWVSPASLPPSTATSSPPNRGRRTGQVTGNRPVSLRARHAAHRSRLSEVTRRHPGKGGSHVCHDREAKRHSGSPVPR